MPVFKAAKFLSFTIAAMAVQILPFQAGGVQWPGIARYGNSWPLTPFVAALSVLQAPKGAFFYWVKCAINCSLFKILFSWQNFYQFLHEGFNSTKNRRCFGRLVRPSCVHCWIPPDMFKSSEILHDAVICFQSFNFDLIFVLMEAMELAAWLLQMQRKWLAREREDLIFLGFF